jgi:hypothetical protein
MKKGMALQQHICVDFDRAAAIARDIDAPVEVSRLVAFALSEDGNCRRIGDQVSPSLILLRIGSRFVLHSKLTCRETSSHFPASQGLPRASASRQPMKTRILTGTEGMSRSTRTRPIAPGRRINSNHSSKTSWNLARRGL